MTLHDGTPGLRSTLEVKLCEPPQASPPVQTPDPTLADRDPACLDFIASNESLDRYQEIISPQGWELDNYRRNPVFQNAHQYGDIIFTLGKALITELRVVDGRQVLFQRIEFATGVNPIARIAFGLYKGKFLNAVSVGFVPLRWEPGEEGSRVRRRFIAQELLEVSAVAIPANPEALILGLKSGAIERNDWREAEELVRASAPGFASRPFEFCSQPAAPPTHAGAPGARSYEAQWLQLARDVRNALKC